MYQNIAELVSLGLTVPLTLLGIWVVRLYWRASLEALSSNCKTSIQWFAIGITVGFLGSSIDNFYWTIPWTASYLELPATAELVNVGTYFNIPFRQLCGIIAAYCHVRSALEFMHAEDSDSGVGRLNKWVLLWLIFGAILASIMMLLKWLT